MITSRDSGLSSRDPDPDSADATPAGHLPGRVLGAVIGVIGACLGLAFAEVVAGTSRTLRSPVLEVGDRFIDRVPPSLKQLAIDWFGTNDKIALLVGIGSVLTIYAAIVGMLWMRRPRWGAAGLSLFAAVGFWASLAARVDRPWWAIAPTLVGAIIAGLVIAGARHLLSRPPGEAPHAGEGVSRRVVGLVGGGLALSAGTGLLGRRLGERFNVGAERDAIELSAPPASLEPVPEAAVAPVEGARPFFTPNEEFYRIDTAITVPQIDPNTWSLKVTGMVSEELELSFQDILDIGIGEYDITLTCVSNEIGGELMGTARWQGIRLDDLLESAGIDSDADQIIGRSQDGYTCGFPVAALDGRDALVAIGMNGEPLPLEHGFPARLIVPGLYGYVSATKWLTEIELTRFDQVDQYWATRGWAAEAPIKLQSRIDTPAGLSSVAPGSVPIAGIAWAQTRGIEGVQVRVDDGEWQDAQLAEEVNDVTWRQWWWDWNATPGRHSVTVRAIERGGAIQTADRAEPMPDGATGNHQIVVLVNET